MAKENEDKPSGFTPIKHLSGSPWNGASNLYYAPSGRTSNGNIFPGDPVKLEANASSVGVPCVDLADDVADVPCGIVVGVVPDPNNLEKKYLPSGTGGYVLVADAPDLIMEVQADNGAGEDELVEDGDIGANVDILYTAGNTVTGRSQCEVDISLAAATSTLKYKILRLVDRPDNILGENAKLEVCFNVHQYGRGTYDVGQTAVSGASLGLHA